MASPSRVLPWVPCAFASRRYRRVVSPKRRLTKHRRGSACSGLPRALVAIRNAIRWYRLVSDEALLKESSEILTNPRAGTRVRCHVTATGEVKGVVRTMDRGEARARHGLQTYATRARLGSSHPFVALPLRAEPGAVSFPSS